MGMCHAEALVSPLWDFHGFVFFSNFPAEFGREGRGALGTCWNTKEPGKCVLDHPVSGDCEPVI